MEVPVSALFVSFRSGSSLGISGIGIGLLIIGISSVGTPRLWTTRCGLLLSVLVSCEASLLGVSATPRHDLPGLHLGGCGDFCGRWILDIASATH